MNSDWVDNDSMDADETMQRFEVQTKTRTYGSAANVKITIL